MAVRKARVDDAPAIHALVNHYARKEVMLPLSLSMVYDRIRDFLVYETGGEVLGCCALHVVWEDLAEIRSLAVREDKARQGIGRALFSAGIADAPALGVNRLFALTFVPEFFRKMGMVQVSKDTLPHKVWSDCVRCPRFPNCDEVAMMADLHGPRIAPPRGHAEGE
jgi:amino-acid N-acetyltransferase